MKNKKICLLLFCFLLCFLCGCQRDDSSWKQEELQTPQEVVGSFEIPKEWSCEYREGNLYVLDGQKEVQLVQTDLWPENGSTQTESNDVYQDLLAVSITSSAVDSNSALYGTMELSDGSQTFEKRWVRFDGDDSQMILLVWNDEISEEMLNRIISSFTVLEETGGNG